MRIQNWRKQYDRIKSDPELYAAYLERKRQERAKRQAATGKETARQLRWRQTNPELAKQIRRAGEAVNRAVKQGKLVRPDACYNCGSARNIEAHHHLGYAREHRLDVVWLCKSCHAKADLSARGSKGEF